MTADRVDPQNVTTTVLGDPIPKGSLVCLGRGPHRLVEDNPRTRRWRKQVAGAFDDLEPFKAYEPVGVEITSTVQRPASHWSRRGTVLPSAPPHPTALRTGDVDKLARLVLDALVDAGILVDDAQVVEVVSRKAYPSPTWTAEALPYPGTRIRLYRIEEA